MVIAMPAACPRRRAAGFTIIELLSVVVVVGILATLGAPSMRELVLKQRVRTVSSDVYASIVLARGEAIKRATTVTVAPVSGSWTNGWTVTTTQSGSAITLETKDAPATVTWSAPTSVVFGANGRMTGSSSVEFRFSLAEYPAVPIRCISISPSGRPNIKTDTDGNGANGCN